MVTRASVLDDFPRPLLFAHRGASAHAPENTLAAFELAVRQFRLQPPAIELDVKLSADQQAVVIHDQTVDRTTDGRGRVNQLTLAQLKALDAGSFFDETYKSERIPSLDDVLEAVGQKAFINIELTNYASPLDHLPRVVAAVIKRHNLARHVMFSSFNPFCLTGIRRWLPDAYCGFLVQPGWMQGWMRFFPTGWIHHQALYPAYKDVTPEMVTAVHKAGRRILVWTVNTPGEIQQLAKWGVDGIFTDDPLVAEQAVAGLQSYT